MGILGILYIGYIFNIDLYYSILPVGVLTWIQACQEKGWAVTPLHRCFFRYQLPPRVSKQLMLDRLVLGWRGILEVEHPATLLAYNMMDYDNGHNAMCFITSSLLYWCIHLMFPSVRHEDVKPCKTPLILFPGTMTLKSYRFTDAWNEKRHDRRLWQSASASAETGAGFGKSTNVVVLLSHVLEKPDFLHVQPFQVVTETK